MNKSLSNEEDLFLKDHQFNIQTQDFYQQNNQILNQPVANNNYIYNNKLDIASNDISTMGYDQYGNYYYNDPLMQQHPQQHQTNQIQYQQQPQQHLQHLHHQQQQDLSFLHTNEQFIQVSIDMIFDKNTSNQIKCLHKAYIDFKYEVLSALQEHHQTQHQLMTQPTSYDYDTEVVLDMFRIYGKTFIKFIEKIPGK
jgi:hypothetical protein